MQSDAFDRAFAFTAKHEGLWSDHPDDRGGKTMRGVTMPTLSEYLGRPARVEELESLSEEMAKDVYETLYWTRSGADKLPPGIDLAVFDFAVNSGVKRAVQFLQRTVNVEDDGVLGRMTLAAVRDAIEEVGAVELVLRYIRARRDFLRRQPNYRTFRRGWEKRVDDLILTVTTMMRP